MGVMLNPAVSWLSSTSMPVETTRELTVSLKFWKSRIHQRVSTQSPSFSWAPDTSTSFGSSVVSMRPKKPSKNALGTSQCCKTNRGLSVMSGQLLPCEGLGSIWRRKKKSKAISHFLRKRFQRQPRPLTNGGRGDARGATSSGGGQ